MWVAIDCRSKNWIAVLNILGSTGIEASGLDSAADINTGYTIRNV
jgi:hypothetical protein